MADQAVTVCKPDAWVYGAWPLTAALLRTQPDSSRKAGWPPSLPTLPCGDNTQLVRCFH